MDIIFIEFGKFVKGRLKSKPNSNSSILFGKFSIKIILLQSNFNFLIFNGMLIS